MKMVILLQRWKIKPGKEKQFEENWSIVTKAIRNECGSYGSRLHSAENGGYVGYAQWPDSTTREKCEIQNQDARKLMSDAIEYSHPEQRLEVKSDWLVSRDFPSDPN